MMATISNERTPTARAIPIAKRVMAISAPTMMATSMKNAVARSLISASLRRKSTPSGVISWRWRSAATGIGLGRDALFSTALTLCPPSRQIEIGRPEKDHEQRNRVAQARVGQELPRDSFKDSGHAEHHHHARHDDGGFAPPRGHGVDARLRAGEGERPAEAESRGGRKRDREKLG